MHYSMGLSFDDVLLVPGYNGIRSRQLVNTIVKYNQLSLDIPLISSNMDTITESKMANFMSDQGGMGILHRFCSIEEHIADFKNVNDQDRVGIAIGIGEKGIQRAEALIDAGASIVCVDVAHGHSKAVNQTVRILREKFNDNIFIIAGNVATYAGGDYLAAAGADAIKVGIGSGSVCTTRIKTGFGVPQLTAIQDCSKVDRLIIADGGIRSAGDCVKALAAGADLVMLGGILAATDETPGDTITKTNSKGVEQKFKQYRGMASKEAQEDFMGRMAEWKTAEGIAIDLPCNGTAKNIINDLMGGIRSGLTYCGALNIKDLQRKAQFIQMTQSGKIESSPHARNKV